MSSISAEGAPKAWSYRDAVRPGLQAIKDHLRPFLLIQACAIAPVIAFYQSPAIQHFAASLATIKVNGGYLFAAISTAFAGVCLPEIFKAIARDPRRYGLRLLAFNFVIFALNGMLVDAFYRLQGVIFGDSASVGTVAIKVLIDQIVFSPFFAVPLVLTLFQWRDLGFDTKATYKALGPNFLRDRVLPVQVVAWAFWTPMTAAVYAMPGDLQFVLFLLAEAAWSMLLIHVAKGQTVTK